MGAEEEDAVGEDEAEEGVSLLDRVPTEVSQVWVVTRVAGSPTINLRTGVGEGKFLSCDKHGLVSADRDARGPQEEWTPVLQDGMVAFQNVYEKYLAIDEAAGGVMTLRGDSEEVGFAERFFVKVQAEYKRKGESPLLHPTIVFLITPVAQLFSRADEGCRISFR